MLMLLFLSCCFLKWPWILSATGEVFGKATVVPLLSASKVQHLINAPLGCAEQTMMLMSPTALSLRYLDRGEKWVQLPAGKRDEAIDFIEKGRN